MSEGQMHPHTIRESSYWLIRAEIRLMVLLLFNSKDRTLVVSMKKQQMLIHLITEQFYTLLEFILN